MRVRDMHLYWCELCWACVILFGIIWAGIAVLAVCALVAGAWTALTWLGGVLGVYSLVLFMVAYGEARSHWKREVGQNGSTRTPR